MEIMTTTADYYYEEMDPSGGNDYNWDYYYEGSTTIYDDMVDPFKIVSLVIYSLVFVLGMLGNGVVIWVTGFKMKKTVNTVWYLNLAVADFLVTAFLPLTITHTALDGHWPFGTFMCKMDFTISIMNMYASIYILMVISVDRCVCVVCPVWAQNHRSVRKASWVSLGVWVLGLALSSPYLVFRNTWPSYHDKNIIWCYNNFALTDDYSRLTPEVYQLSTFRSGVMIITSFLMGFVVPFTVIVSCYSVIIYRLRNNHSLAGQSGRPFKIIATVITVFFLCWAPYHIIDLITEYSGTLYDGLTIGSRIAFCLALLNSCLNPLLYVFMGHDFKAVFRSSILKVLEKAFTEELPQTNTFTNPGSTSQETALSETQV